MLLGRLFRPISPSAEKSETYECGEPPIGSSFVQFDLRFYVVALLFIIFEIELAFFFPPAVVFGKLTQIFSIAATQDTAAGIKFRPPTENQLDKTVVDKFRELGVAQISPDTTMTELASQTRSLAAAAMIDMGLFFVILLVGFAYLWKRGDLDWVRAVRSPVIQSEVNDESARNSWSLHQ